MSWEDPDENRENMQRMFRREEYLGVLLTVLEVLLKNGATDALQTAQTLAQDITSHVEDLHPLSGN